MRRSISNTLKLMLFSILFWTIAMCFFVFFRYFDLEQEPGVTVEEGFAFSASQVLSYGFIMGVMIGIPYALIDVLLDKILKSKISLGLSIIIRTFFYLVTLVITVTILMVLVEIQLGINLPNDPGWWRSNKIFWVFIGYFGLFSLVFTLLKVGRDRFGREAFIGIMLGRYSNPREEDRIFMFLDLRSSTTIAEKLGHLVYSSFIRDCFLDLNQILSEFEAEVYQYVGDEAVLSWKYHVGLRRDNCVRVFFEFESRLGSRQEYYSKRYGIVPEFKAGLHGGTLVVVEVGSVKKELAYHGDVINTSARIQDQCNVFGENLLVSESLLRDMTLNTQFETKELGELTLRGKTEDLGLFAIHDTKKNP